MTAVVTPMPGVRLLTVQRLPLERREALLAWLAENALDLPAEVVTLSRDAFSHDSLYGPALDAAWQEYRYRLMVRHDAEDGRADWHCHLFEDPPGPDSGEAAVQRAQDDAAEALTFLARGSHATNGGTR